jgi:hypothetical protein
LAEKRREKVCRCYTLGALTDALSLTGSIEPLPISHRATPPAQSSKLKAKRCSPFTVDRSPTRNEWWFSFAVACPVECLSACASQWQAGEADSSGVSREMKKVWLCALCVSSLRLRSGQGERSEWVVSTVKRSAGGWVLVCVC